jgi:capsular exopolysaccharide synthesis family protein
MPFSEEIRSYLITLDRRRGVVAVTLCAALSLAALVNNLATPLYRANAYVMTSPLKPDVLPGREIVRQGPELFATPHRLVAVQGLAEGAVRRLGLEDDAALRGGGSWWSRVREVVDDLKGGERPSQARVTAVFRSQISVTPIPDSLLFEIGFTASSAELAARAANTLAELYVEWALASGEAKAVRVEQWLEDRLGEARGAAEGADKQLASAPMSHGQRELLVSQRLTALTANLSRAHADRITKESRFEALSKLSPADIVSAPLVATDGALAGATARLSELRREWTRRAETLGDRHPEMIRLRSQLLEADREQLDAAQRLRRSLERDYQAALSEEKALESAIAKLAEEARALRQSGVAYESMQREAKVEKDLYQTLMSRAKESRVQAELRPEVRIEQRAAAPALPFYPDGPKNYLIAAAAGLLLSLWLAFVVDGYDQSIRTPDDVKQHLGLPVIGFVPKVISQSGDTIGPVILGDPRSSLAEAYRFAEIGLCAAPAPPDSGRVIVVTSACPAEGKSITATNLAASLARSGQRILLVDADIRRPRVHRHLGVAIKPGLSELMMGECGLAEAVRATRFRGVFALTAGRPVTSPAEILTAERLRDLVPTLRARFDWAMLDTPPLTAVADALLLSPLGDGVVLVVAAESTSRQAVKRSLEQLAIAGGRPLGVLLNKVDLKRNAYYYRQYYPEYYSRYEADASDPRQRRAG